ncbi:MFS transporter [Paracidovorax citrulli]|uniref:MFS transporter n=1 Tax=Paracidovorax citrulli TaxID=80869 RepID=UPI0005FB7462|nr:MFS transporter [Paracidovorax citrulli]
MPERILSSQGTLLAEPAALPQGQAGAGIRPDARRWMALAVLLTGALLPPLDFFIVNVALPAMRADLAASAAMSQMVISVYAAAYAVTLILGGRLGDLYGRRRVFICGMLGFGASSVLCGLATSPGVLVVGRLLQGLTAAVMAPQPLATIHAFFPAHEKNRALGLYGAVFGMAAVAGQGLGGALVAADWFGLGWRSVFLVNLPVVALAVPATLMLVRESRSAQAMLLDVRGAGLLAAGLLALLIPLIEGREHGWPWWCFGLLVACVPLLRAFWRFEQGLERAGGAPLLAPSLLAQPGLRRSLAATLCFYSIAPFFLIFSIYQQAGLGRGPLAAGLALMPMGVGFLCGSLCSRGAALRLGAGTATFGMVVEVLGMLSASALAVAHHAPWLVLPLFAIGLGQGMAMPALVRLNMDQVDARWAGLSAGLVHATLQIGAAISVAVIGGLFFVLAPQGAGAGAVQVGFSVTSAIIGACLAGAAMLAWKVRPRAD